MRARTVLASMVLASLALVAHCTRRSPPAMISAAAPSSTATETETHPSSSEMEAPAGAALAPIVPVVSDDPFVANIHPILATRCAPCHNPGGKMYARLPFDDSKTVAANSEGILRRLKGDDRAALEKWLAGMSPTSKVQSPK